MTRGGAARGWVWGSIVVAAFQDSVLIPVVTELRLKRPDELGPVVRGLFGATLVSTLAASAVASLLGLGHALFAAFALPSARPALNLC